jgi:hypothetical protein
MIAVDNLEMVAASFCHTRRYYESGTIKLKRNILSMGYFLVGESG